MNDTELYHYGVRGMKWGVRRQNERKAFHANRYNKNMAKAERAREKMKTARTQSGQDRQRGAAAIYEARAKSAKYSMEGQYGKAFTTNLKDAIATVMAGGAEARGKIMRYKEEGMGSVQAVLSAQGQAFIKSAAVAGVASVGAGIIAGVMTSRQRSY